VPVGGSAVLYATGPSQLRVQGKPLFYELARARSEPTDATGELVVDRRWFEADAAKGERGPPLAGRVPLGKLVWVELTVAKARLGEVLSIDDRFPGGLAPVEQPATSGPVEKLLAAGGSVSFAGDRVRLQTVAASSTVKVGYLARAILPGTYTAPPCLAESGDRSGQSTQERLIIGDSL
jgi:hypothetical protein